MRVALGSISQESNTFVPFRTGMQGFIDHYVRRGDELLTGFGAARVEIPGMLAVLRAAGATPVPLLAAYAGAGGPIERPVFEALLGEMLARLKAALPVDGVLLALHGAMAVEDEEDAESEILERVRALVPPGTPLGVSFDLHAHVTPRLLQPDVFIVGYQQYPHVDLYETGERTARLLLATLAGRRQPVMALAKRPMIVSPVNGRTADGPLGEVAAAARALEADGAVLHASLFPVQPWLDFEDLGLAALVCADRDAAAAQAAADRLADMAWERRERLLPNLIPLEEAIRIGLGEPGLTVVSDSGDAPSGGAGGDNVAVLRALLAAGADRAERLTYLTLVDPPAARLAAAAGPGATVLLSLGHHFSRDDGSPITVPGRVQAVTDGDHVMRDAGAQGTRAQMGLTAAIALGAIRIAVRSVPGLEWDTGICRSVGLDPRDAALVFVKSPSHFRAALAPIADRILVADTPGPTCPNMCKVPFRRVRRPVHPLDPI
jgi:microcystin degradation protein MlrC